MVGRKVPNHLTPPYAPKTSIADYINDAMERILQKFG